MKILYLSAYLPGRGLHGGSSRIFELLHYLHRRHEITLLCFRHEKDDESRLKDLKAMCKRVSVVEMSRRRPFYLFPFEPFIDYESSEFRKRIQKTLQREKFDLVQFEYVQMGIFRNELRGLPQIMTEHEVNFLAHLKRIAYLKNPVARLKTYYNALQLMKRELGILQGMDRTICMNDPDRAALMGYVPAEKLEVLPHGVDTAYFTPQPDIQPDPYAIGFFGAYQHQPNVDAVQHFVQRIFPLVKERIPLAHFHVIGSNPPREIQELSKRADVTVTGFVPDIRTYLARCAVVVAPLRLGLGMRVKMVEALAMGRPVVATALACAGLEVEDGRHVYIANNDAGFAESVCYLLQDSTTAQALGREARTMVEGLYHYNTIGGRLERMYQEMAGKPVRAAEPAPAPAAG